MKHHVTTLLVVGLIGHAAAAAAADPATVCQSGKLKVAGKYGSCLLGAEAKGVKTASTPDFSKCDSTFSDKWQKAEAKAGTGTCLVEGDETGIGQRITAHADILAILLAGGTPVECGNGIVDGGDQCDGMDLDGQTCTGLGYSLGGSLACGTGCGFDASGCLVGVAGQIPASGQTTSYGAGDDGDVQAGATLAYVDNGDGTITDSNTGLTWEKKLQQDYVYNACIDDSGGCANPHDADNSYTWTAGGSAFDGAVVTVFLDQLNNRCNVDTVTPCTVDADCTVPGGTCGFAGHRDWRLPNQKELNDMLDYGEDSPAVDPAFHGVSCGVACGDLTNPACACDGGYYTWTSTTGAGNSGIAWAVHTGYGGAGEAGKQTQYYARAVRGGS